MVVFTIAVILDAAYYEVRTCSCVLDLCLYSFADEIRSGGLDRPCCLPRSLLEPTKGFRVEGVERRSCSIKPSIQRLPFIEWSAFRRIQLHTQATAVAAGVKTAFISRSLTKIFTRNKRHTAAARTLKFLLYRSKQSSGSSARVRDEYSAFCQNRP